MLLVECKIIAGKCFNLVVCFWKSVFLKNLLINFTKANGIGKYINECAPHHDYS